MIVQRILAVPGSLRQGSFTTTLLNAAARLAAVGIVVTLYEDLAQVPPFNEDLEAGPGPLAVARFRKAIEEADGLLIATPEYNGSIPGQLKNALDWASRPARRSVLQGKPVATCSASPGPGGGAGAQEDLRRVLARSGARVVGDQLTLPSAYRQFDSTGTLIDMALRNRLTEILSVLAAAVPTSQPMAVNARERERERERERRRTMYAVVRHNNYDPKRLARAGDELAEFQELHAAQLGYAGNLTIEMQPGRWLTATLWDTEAHAAAARETLRKHVQRLLSPLMTGPSELLGMGVIVASDLVRVGSN